MTTIDFDSPKRFRPTAGMLYEPFSNAAYVKLYTHKPLTNTEGKPWKPRGAVVTPRFPAEDWPGLLEMAGKGLFPWPVDSEPEMKWFPGSSKVDFDNRREVLKAWEFYTEKFGSEEPSAEAETEPEPQLPEPVFQKEPDSKLKCECGFEPKGFDKSGRELTPNKRAHALAMHRKRSHAQAATASRV